MMQSAYFICRAQKKNTISWGFNLIFNTSGKIEDGGQDCNRFW